MTPYAQSLVAQPTQWLHGLWGHGLIQVWLFLLSLQKDLPWRRETVKSALMLMYSCVASYCHPQLLLTLVDNPIATKIIHHYSSSCQVACP